MSIGRWISGATLALRSSDRLRALVGSSPDLTPAAAAETAFEAARTYDAAALDQAVRRAVAGLGHRAGPGALLNLHALRLALALIDGEDYRPVAPGMLDVEALLAEHGDLPGALHAELLLLEHRRGRAEPWTDARSPAVVDRAERLSPDHPDAPFAAAVRARRLQSEGRYALALRLLKDHKPPPAGHVYPLDRDAALYARLDSLVEVPVRTEVEDLIREASYLEPSRRRLLADIAETAVELAAWRRAWTPGEGPNPARRLPPVEAVFERPRLQRAWCIAAVHIIEAKLSHRGRPHTGDVFAVLRRAAMREHNDLVLSVGDRLRRIVDGPAELELLNRLAATLTRVPGREEDARGVRDLAATVAGRLETRWVESADLLRERWPSADAFLTAGADLPVAERARFAPGAWWAWPGHRGVLSRLAEAWAHWGPMEGFVHTVRGAYDAADLTRIVLPLAIEVGGPPGRELVDLIERETGGPGFSAEAQRVRALVPRDRTGTFERAQETEVSWTMLDE